MILQILAAFVGTLGFSVVFNVPKSELFFCGISGASGWMFYQIIINIGGSNVIATLAAAIIITSMSRFLSFNRKMPLTVFLISGIIPLVPGAGIYYTMFDILASQTSDKGIETLKTAGVIAIGIIIVFSLPKKLFNHKFLIEKKT